MTEKATPVANRKAAALLNSIADAFESGEYCWGKDTYYQTSGTGLELCAVAAARFEIAGKPVEPAGWLARNEKGPRNYNPAYSKLIGILTGEDSESFLAVAEALIAADPEDRVNLLHTMPEFKVTNINDRLASPEQAVAWIRRAARYAATVARTETGKTSEPAKTT